MRRVQVYEGPLAGGQLTKLVDAIVLDEDAIASVEKMRNALQTIADTEDINGTATALTMRELAREALKS